jgi:hypothetical protein
LKKSNLPKMVNAMDPRIHAASKATERQQPCVVMKRTDSIHPVQLRAATECRGWVKHRWVR